MAVPFDSAGAGEMLRGARPGSSPVSAGSIPAISTFLEYDLRFCVLTQPSGRVELRYFASPRDAEGLTIRLTPLEREQLGRALAVPGFHPITRDDASDPQLALIL